MPIDTDYPSFVENNYSSEHLDLSEFDRPHEECGLVVMIADDGEPVDEDLLLLSRSALMAIQNRGEHSASICVPDGDDVFRVGGNGVIEDGIDPELLKRGAGKSPIIIGHNRWATAGEKNKNEVNQINNQPILHPDRYGMPVITAVNGNSAYAGDLVDMYGMNVPEECSDTYIMAKHAASIDGPLEQKALGLVDEPVIEESAFAGVMAQGDSVMFFRDKYGLRPLIHGRFNHHGRSIFMVASETLAFDKIGATVEGELPPGSVLKCKPGQRELIRPGGYDNIRGCVFEPIYFMNSRSKMPVPGMAPEAWPYVEEVRESIGFFMGAIHKDTLRGSDLIVPIPKSGIPFTRGLARGAGMDNIFMELFVRRGKERSFINGGNVEATRKIILRKLAFNPDLGFPDMSLEQFLQFSESGDHPDAVARITNFLRNKKIATGDDSIIQGTSSREVNIALRLAGLADISSFSSMPATVSGCDLGANLKDVNGMLFNRFQGDYEAMAEYIQANRVVYPGHNLFLMGIRNAMNMRYHDGSTPRDLYIENQACGACLTGQKIEGTIRPGRLRQTIDLTPRIPVLA